MRSYAVFYGGGSYSHPYADEAEEFQSLAAVKRRYADALRGLDRRYPCVDENACVTVWFYDPTADDVRDPYPDAMICVGKRDGLRLQRL